jgi:parallel beta-helix repeat protein
MKNKKIKKSTAFIIAILFIGVCIIPICNSVKVNNNIGISGNVSGNILYVGGSGGENYSTIQEAIDDATAGDTVFVYDDSSPYQENIRINKQILVLGENRDTTIINGLSGQDHAVRISSKNAEINGFTIIGATGGQDGITVYPLIENSIISNNIVKDSSYGIFLQATSSRITIMNNIISNNEFEGIILQESDRNIISGNTVTNNGDYGIAIEAISKQNEIIDNTVENNFAGIQLTGGSSQNTISGNQVLDNDREGIKIEGVLTTTNEIIENNITGNNAGMKITSGGKNNISSNNFKNNNIEGLYLIISNENIIEKNNFMDNRKNARFIASFRNTWDSNYWDDWIGIKIDIPLFKNFPKTIRGIAIRNYDVNPQEEPYNI